MKDNFQFKYERTVGGGIPESDVPGWKKILKEGGLSKDEVMSMLSRVRKSLVNRKSIVRNAVIGERDIPEWVQTLAGAGFTPEEIEETLDRINTSTDDKNEIRGFLRKIQIKNDDLSAEINIDVKK